MKRLLIILTAIVGSFITSQAQDALWITGSAVPSDSPVQLTKRPDGKFTFTGALNAGELKVMTTATYQQGTTRFLAPQLTDAYLINYGLVYTQTSDTTRAGWVVSFQEDSYRFVIDTSVRKLTGELFLPWNELLIAGSAFEGGSDNVEWKRDNMLPFTRSHDDPYVFEWTGYLDTYDNVVEPGCFKLEGQMTWGPRELHPYTANEDILTSTYVRFGGDDTKWRITQSGVYHIRVDLFHETVRAELVPQEMPSVDGNGGASAIETIEAPNEVVAGAVASYDLLGRPTSSSRTTLYIERMADGSMRKVFRR